MKEYGSSVQKLVEHIVSIPDKETRTKHAHILVELMRQVHPQMRDGADYSKKLWDDLYIMANFDLDVDSPFPAPPKEILGKKPQQIPYTQSKLKHKFYGRNLELLILKAMMAETFEERVAFVSYLVKLMKSFFLSWNRDSIETKACLEQILTMSGGKLKPEIDHLVANGIVDEASPRDSNNFRQRGNFNNNRNNSRNNNQRNGNAQGGGRNNKFNRRRQ